MKRILQKLKRTSGFTLTETLAVVIILLLVSGVVAAGMPVAANAYTKVVDSGNAQVLFSTTMTALREELSTATEIETTTKDGKILLNYYRSARYGVLARLSNSDDGIMLGYYYKQKNDSDEYEYVSYGDDYVRPLVSTAAATGLTVGYKAIEYDETNKLFTVKGLVVKKGSQVLAGDEESGSYVIRILNP